MLDEKKNKSEFTVYGDPFGKERPRAARKGKFVTVYTPKKTAEYEKKVRRSFLDNPDCRMIDGGVDVDITAYHRIPKNTPKKNIDKMLKGEILCTVKPDADNIAKCILDPLNGIAFEDDNHVVKLLVEKRYGTIPRVDVCISQHVAEVIEPLFFVNNIIEPLFFIQKQA